MNRSKELQKLLSSDDTLIMPDAYDPISAKIIEKSGFKAVQCSGYSFSIAAARRKEIDISRSENIEITKGIVDAVDVPVMADAEDGYGNAAVVEETVSKFIDTGVAGLNLEDQILDGKSNSIINEEMMVEKIHAARESAEIADNSDFIINGRTDVFKSIENREEALNLAIERSNLYLQAGADITFVTYVETIEEVKTLKKEVKGPISIAAGMPYNIGKLSIGDLKKLGVNRISLPNLLIYSSLKALDKSLKHVKNDDIENMDNMLYNLDDLNELLNPTINLH
jgi:2-methylisocitrate lyase-like PEP mutase family enzyme